MKTLRIIVIRLFTDVRAIQVWNVAVILFAIVTGYAHVMQFLEAFSQDLIQGALELEEDIALIIVAYGVLLEERYVLLKRLSAHIPEKEEVITGLFERYGAYILMIGLFMEMIDQAFEPIIAKAGFEPLGIGLMLVFDLATILLMLRFIWFCRNPKLTE